MFCFIRAIGPCIKHGPGYSCDKYSMPKVFEEFPSAPEDSEDSSED